MRPSRSRARQLNCDGGVQAEPALRGTWPRSGASTCTPCPAPAPGPARLARPRLVLFLSPSLSLSLPSAARSLDRLEPQRSARDESLQWHEFNSTLFILRTMWIHSRQPRLHLAGRSARGGGGRRPRRRRRKKRRRGGGGRSAPLTGPALRSADASLTPGARKEGGGKGGSGRPAGFRGAEAALALPHPRLPPGPCALGLFHWRTLPKMVICVRGRECGFPRFRVTWRERDSLARSLAHRGLPRLEKGLGAGPQRRPRGPRL